MLTALVLLAHPLAGHGQLPNLELRLLADDAWLQTVRQSFYLPGEKELDHAFVFETGRTVVEPKGTEYTIQESRRFVESWVGDLRLPAPRSATPIVEQVFAKRTGEMTTGRRLYPSPAEFRLARVLWILTPTTLGAQTKANSWSVAFPANEGGTVPGANATWTPMGAVTYRSRAAIRLGVEFGESNFPVPISGRGEALVDSETGVPLKITMTLTGVRSPGGDEILDATIEMRVTSLKRTGKELLSVEQVH
jgi:hypothetical protein